MKNQKAKIPGLDYLLCSVLSLSGLNAAPEKITNIRASASSEFEQYQAQKAVDGKISDDSRWVSKTNETESWLLLEWDKAQALQGVHLFSGWGDQSPVPSLNMHFKNAAGEWVEIPSATLDGNKEVAVALRFDATVAVKTKALKLTFKNAEDDRARVKEVFVWKDSKDQMPAIAKVQDSVRAVSKVPLIYLNQSGFNIGEPKRFTVPTLQGEVPFVIKPVAGGDPVYEGVIRDHLGDFSDFEPKDDREYEVHAGGHVSVPFKVGLWHFERITYQPSIDFMVDSRHYVGNYRKRCRGSFAWRDDHHFGWMLRSIVPQYLSNPAAYERMPKQIKYEKPRDNLWGALESYDESAPDIVKLIHWGADVTVTQGTIHEMLKGELAYFLYAWPWLKQWLPQQNYDAVLSFAEKTWALEKADRKYPYDETKNHNLFALKTIIGSTKGGNPPGHSLMPNLLMYHALKRDGHANADRYFDSAYAQAEWMIEELDWEDPQVTKGQRMSEHLTMTGLATFLEMYPERAPKGLRKKINEWADVMVRRSENMWDFRKLTDNGQWTPSGSSKMHWNEVGNVVGFPAALLAAEPFVDKPETKERFRELVWSHMDNSFGRNPCGRHFSYDAPREIEGVEHGWYSFYKGGIGQLAGARFVLDGAPKHVHYPYQPEKGNYGWTEGWVTFNSAFNHSLAYLAKADTEIQLKQEGSELQVTLKAPLNFDPQQSEPVEIKLEGKTTVQLKLIEAEPSSPYHIGRIALTKLGVKAGDQVSASYGYGYMKNATDLKLK